MSGRHGSAGIGVDGDEQESLGGTVSDRNIPRVEYVQPSLYRLLQKKDGTIALQGAYGWAEGELHGYSWREIDTVKEGEVKHE